MRKALRAGLGAVLLAGCYAQPARQPVPVPVAPTFTAANDSLFRRAPAVGAFWEQLGDTTLAGLVREALAGSLDLQGAAARVSEARAAARGARFDLAPTITAAGGYTRRRIAAAQFPGLPSSIEQTLWDAGVEASWEIDLFGRLRRNIAGSNALARASEEDRRAVQVSLVSEIGRTYFELRGAQEQLAVAELNAANQRRTLELTVDRLDAGRGTAFDRERAQAQLAGTLALIPLLEARIAASRFRLATLLGQPPGALDERLRVPKSLPTLPERPVVADPRQLVDERPDVRAAERQLAASTAFVGAARAEYLPRLAVSGNAGFTSPTFERLGGTNTSRYSVGPVLSWPLLNLGRVGARVDEARARAEQSRASYGSTVLRALEETESALVTYDRTRARVALLREAAEASRRAAELARIRFDGGLSDFLQVLDAERTLLEAQDRLAQGRTDLVTAFVALYRALGGTWPIEGAAENGARQ